MRLQNLWPLLFLLCIPVIILIWMLKQKASDYPISSLFLWKEAYKNVEAATPWERFRNHLPMYLQILTVLAVILAMAAPYIPGASQDFSHVVVAIDTSGSMNAMYDDRMTRFEAAVDDAREYIGSLSDDTSISIISMGHTDTIELAATTDKSAALERLKSIKLTDASGDLASSMDFIASMTASMEKGAAAIFTDRAVDGAPGGFMVYSYGSGGSNAGIDYVSHSMGDDGITVLVRATNYSQTPYGGDINLYVDGTLTDIGEIRLGAGESGVVYFNLEDRGGSIIKAELNNDDMLMKDNTAYDFLDAKAGDSILLVSQQNVFLEKALAALGGAEVYKTSDAAVDKTFDTYIFDGIYPQTLPEKGNLIFINPPALVIENEAAATDEIIEESPRDDNTAGAPDFIKVTDVAENIWLTAADCQLMSYIYPYDLAVSSVALMEKPAWATSFLNDGSKSAGFYGSYDGRFVAVLGFDLHNTDFALQTQFPIFIHNLLTMCENNRLVSSTDCTAGERITLNASPSGGDVTMTGPDGQSQTFAVGQQPGPLLTAGVYTFSQEVDGQTNVSLVHADFPTSGESGAGDTQVLKGAEAGRVSGGETMTGLGINLRPIFIIITLILLMAEWLIYLKRI